tara:strand:- start:1494 stop:1766 length:273 start_codon:yes stop_codon:yes gene_type:complete
MTSFRSIASKAQTGKQYAEMDAMKRLEELSAMKREEIELDTNLQSIVDGMKALGIYIEQDMNGKSDLDKLIEDEMKKVLRDFSKTIFGGV